MVNLNSCLLPEVALNYFANFRAATAELIFYNEHCFRLRLPEDVSSIIEDLSSDLFPFGKFYINNECGSNDLISVDFIISAIHFDQKIQVEFEPKRDFHFRTPSSGNENISEFSVGFELENTRGFSKLLVNSGTGNLIGLLGNEIVVFYNELSTLRGELRRIIKHLLVFLVENEGGFFLHGSSVCSDDGSVIIVGPKGAGKTTIMMSLLKAGFSFISNDRVIIKQKNNGHAVFGWPDPVRIVQKNDLKKNIGLKELGRDYRIEESGKSLIGFVFPELGGEGHTSVTPISADIGKIELHKHFLTPNDPIRTRWLGFNPSFGKFSEINEKVLFLKCTGNYALRDRLVSELIKNFRSYSGTNY